MKVKTQSGSVYEIKQDTKQIRRLSGTKKATARQGEDVEWRTYDAIFPDPIKVGNQMIILYPDNVPLLEGTKEIADVLGMSTFPATTTSVVVEIEE